MTGPEEVGSSTIEASWAGGIDGRQVIDAFLPLIPVTTIVFNYFYQQTMLSKKGVVYLVVINENKPKEILTICKEKYGLNGSVRLEI